MRATPRVLAIALAMEIGVGCRAASTELTGADRASIEHLIDEVARTLKAGDFQSWAGHFSEDAAIYPPNAPMVKGRATIQKWGEGFPPVQELSFSDTELWGDGSLAYATSAYRFTPAGSPTDIGKQLWVFRRTTGKGWEVAAASYNSDLPGKGAQAFDGSDPRASP